MLSVTHTFQRSFSKKPKETKMRIQSIRCIHRQRICFWFRFQGSIAVLCTNPLISFSRSLFKARSFQISTSISDFRAQRGGELEIEVSISDFRFQACERERNRNQGFDFRFQTSGSCKGEKSKSRFRFQFQASISDEPSQGN